MRIGIVAPPWTPVPPPLYGGTELVVDRLARGFADAGHDVLLFASGDSTCPVPTESVIELAEGGRIGHVVPELHHVLAAYDAMRRFAPDIVHDHTVSGPLLRHSDDLTIVTTCHDPLEGDRGAILRRADKPVPLIAISHAQRRAAPNVPVFRVIHHGLDAEEFPVGAGDGGYCLFLGRMSPDKGAHRAMEAAYKAGVPLLMAAKMRTGDEFEYFDVFVRPYLNDDLRYLGEVSHEDKIELLAGARALLFPIRWNEPFGMVMLEALACGTPVLAFAEGATPEVIDDGRTGYLCHDVADMADAIGRIHTLDRRACRAEVEGYFSASRMVDEHLASFEELVRR